MAAKHDPAIPAEVFWGPFAKMGAAWADSMGEMGREVMHFMAERIREDIDTQKRLMECKDPQELAHVQAEFLQKAIDQYTAETGKLVEISGDMLEAMGLPRDEPG